MKVIMKRPIHIQTILKPHEGSEKEQHEVLEMVASVIADRLIDSARRDSIENSKEKTPAATHAERSCEERRRSYQ